jgi:hypothetical protein
MFDTAAMSALPAVQQNQGSGYGMFGPPPKPVAPVAKTIYPAPRRGQGYGMFGPRPPQQIPTQMPSQAPSQVQSQMFSVAPNQNSGVSGFSGGMTPNPQPPTGGLFGGVGQIAPMPTGNPLPPMGLQHQAPMGQPQQMSTMQDTYGVGGMAPTAQQAPNSWQMSAAPNQNPGGAFGAGSDVKPLPVNSGDVSQAPTPGWMDGGQNQGGIQPYKPGVMGQAGGMGGLNAMSTATPGLASVKPKPATATTGMQPTQPNSAGSAMRRAAAPQTTDF